MRGSSIRLTTRGRWALAALAAVVLAVGGLAAWASSHHDLLVRPGRPCGAIPLRTYQGVTLQPAAMVAYKKAQHRAHGQIEVVQSYRSCAEQALACKGICGHAQGCPGRCARPGTSYHQLGAAIDITQDSLDTPGVILALEETGWCESEPASDPGHFSFDGCH